MKFKLLFLAMAFAIGANAQNNTKCNDKDNCCKNDKNIFNHLSVGVNLGTTGIGFDVAMPICNYVQVRAGVDFMPNIKVSTDFDIDAPDVQGYDIPNNIEAEGKVGFTNGKLLFDVYPFKSSSFHVTAGAYFGSSKVIKAYNKENGILSDVADFNNDVEAGLLPGYDKIGVELGITSLNLMTTETCRHQSKQMRSSLTSVSVSDAPFLKSASASCSTSAYSSGAHPRYIALTSDLQKKTLTEVMAESSRPSVK